MPDVQTITATIDNVVGPNRNGFYDIDVTGPAGPLRLSTKKPEMAQAAAGGVGGSWRVSYTTRVNGEYTNHYLVGVSGIPNVDVAGPTPAAPTKPAPGGRDPQQALQIMRQSALERAIRAVGPIRDDQTINEAIDMYFLVAERFLDYFQNGPRVQDEIPFD